MYKTTTIYNIGDGSKAPLFSTTDKDAADWLVKFARFDKRMPALSVSPVTIPSYE